MLQKEIQVLAISTWTGPSPSWWWCPAWSPSTRRTRPARLWSPSPKWFLPSQGQSFQRGQNVDSMELVVWDVVDMEETNLQLTSWLLDLMDLRWTILGFRQSSSSLTSMLSMSPKASLSLWPYPHTDCKKDGFQELSGDEPVGSGDSWFHQCHLLGHDRHPNPEQDDRGQHMDHHMGWSVWGRGRGILGRTLIQEPLAWMSWGRLLVVALTLDFVDEKENWQKAVNDRTVNGDATETGILRHFKCDWNYWYSLFPP